MISLQELNPHKYPTDSIIDSNLLILLNKLNVLRAAYAKPMIITSGLRSPDKQAQLIQEGKSKATHSRHLTGQAADILDQTGDLWKWCMVNMQLLIDTGIWLEERQGPWCHCQIVPPASGKRIFKP